MLTIETKRFSAVVMAFVERYPAAVAKLNKRPVDTPVAEWCTNAYLKAAIDFSLRSGNVELPGFHDGPTNMWASDEALPLVEELASRKVLRFSNARRSRRWRRLLRWKIESYA